MQTALTRKSLGEPLKKIPITGEMTQDELQKLADEGMQSIMREDRFKRYEHHKYERLGGDLPQYVIVRKGERYTRRRLADVWDVIVSLDKENSVLVISVAK